MGDAPGDNPEVNMATGEVEENPVDVAAVEVEEDPVVQQLDQSIRTAMSTMREMAERLQARRNREYLFESSAESSTRPDPAELRPEDQNSPMQEID